VGWKRREAVVEVVEVERKELKTQIRQFFFLLFSFLLLPLLLRGLSR